MGHTKVVCSIPDTDALDKLKEYCEKAELLIAFQLQPQIHLKCFINALMR
jgi:hypothetical protein